jgi:glycosyltransferase involved in cell wall biosynthesis
MPLKRQFVREFDKVYAVSEEGCKSLAESYGFEQHQLEVARLGVALPPDLAASSDDSVVRIVSVSFCEPVKRIDRIVRAVRSACESDPGTRFEWMHIGGGTLQGQLEALAAKLLDPLPNADYTFAGSMPNEQVLSFYATSPVDVFVNCSDSEGIPVSIMEAMARGIPAVAPAIGGIPELIDAGCGALLPPGFTANDVASAIGRLIGTDRQQYRSAARQRVKDRFDAHSNFDTFVLALKRLHECATVDSGPVVRHRG